MNINGYFSLVISFFHHMFSLESGRHSYNPKCQLRGISWQMIVFWSLSTPAWSWYASTTSTGICVWKLGCIGVVLRGTRHPKSMEFTLRKGCSLEYTWHSFWSIGFSFLISAGQFTGMPIVGKLELWFPAKQTLQSVQWSIPMITST